MNTILYVLQISSSVALSPGVVPPRPPSLKTQQTHSREQQHPPGAPSYQSRQTRLIGPPAAWLTKLRLAAVSGPSGDLLPPIYLEYEFDRWPVVENCTSSNYYHLRENSWSDVYLQPDKDRHVRCDGLSQFNWCLKHRVSPYQCQLAQTNVTKTAV